MGRDRPHRYAVDYDRRQHEVYQRGRALSRDVVDLWMQRVQHHVPAGIGWVADVGAGTGRFCPPLGETLDAAVVGVDPSIEMLRHARRDNGHEHVRYVAGRAERLPLAPDSVDVAFLSMVAHHLRDLHAVASELTRVSRPDGMVVLRNVFAGRLGEIPLFRYFPEALRIEDSRAPSIEAIEGAFGDRGWDVVALETVQQETDPSLTSYYERLSQRALSVFEFLDEAQIDEGMKKLRAEAQAETSPSAVVEPIDLLVLRLS